MCYISYLNIVVIGILLGNDSIECMSCCSIVKVLAGNNTDKLMANFLHQSCQHFFPVIVLHYTIAVLNAFRFVLQNISSLIQWEAGGYKQDSVM